MPNGTETLLQTKGQKNSTHWWFTGKSTGNHRFLPVIGGSSEFSIIFPSNLQ
jgi:hypothetical protein